MAQLVYNNDVIIHEDGRLVAKDINKVCINGTEYSINHNKIRELEARVQVLENLIQQLEVKNNQKYITVYGGFDEEI